MDEPNAIGWFDIYVEDMDRAAAFYEALLQQPLEFIDDPTGETLMRCFPANMKAYGAGGALVKSSHARPGPGGTLVYFSVDDCAVEQAQATAAGGAVARPKLSIGQFGRSDAVYGYQGEHVRTELDAVKPTVEVQQ